MAVTLRGPHTIDDLDAVLDRVMTWINEPAVVKNLANFNKTLSWEEEREWLRATLQSPTDRIYSIEDGLEYIGQAGIHQIYWPARHGRVSTIIREPFQHAGYGLKANILLMGQAFDTIGLNKLWSVVWADNPRTNRLFKTLRYRHVGVLKDEYVVKTAKGMVFHDMNRYEMLAKDHAKLKANGYYEALLEPASRI